MIKFIHKKNIERSIKNSKIVIYYNAADIFLGTTLIILVGFFIHNYLANSYPGLFVNNSIAPSLEGSDAFLKNDFKINP
jgi:hypothetical protein